MPTGKFNLSDEGVGDANKETSYNLDGILLLGRDDVLPAYTTDALLRRVNVDRYNDREIVETNLIESYENCLHSHKKHMLYKFYLEKGKCLSLRCM